MEVFGSQTAMRLHGDIPGTLIYPNRCPKELSTGPTCLCRLNPYPKIVVSPPQIRYFP
jgi:hypothetical protein